MAHTKIVHQHLLFLTCSVSAADGKPDVHVSIPCTFGSKYCTCNSCLVSMVTAQDGVPGHGDERLSERHRAGSQQPARLDETSKGRLSYAPGLKPQKVGCVIHHG
jgi:hypothetical protein